jgi:hypothetical protein
MRFAARSWTSFPRGRREGRLRARPFTIYPLGRSMRRADRDLSRSALALLFHPPKLVPIIYLTY